MWRMKTLIPEMSVTETESGLAHRPQVRSLYVAPKAPSLLPFMPPIKWELHSVLKKDGKVKGCRLQD